MTTEQFMKQLKDHADVHGLAKPFPRSMKVDADTYAHLCESLFKSNDIKVVFNSGQIKIIEVSIGPSNGPFIKNIEILLEKNK